jgi:hypothetical protein
VHAYSDLRKNCERKTSNKDLESKNVILFCTLLSSLSNLKSEYGMHVCQTQITSYCVMLRLIK